MEASEADIPDPHVVSQSWTIYELTIALGEFEAEARRAGLAPTSVHTYVNRAQCFVRWLDGEFHFRGPAR